MRPIDPHLLDDITGSEALDWANAWSRATEDALESPDTAELRSRPVSYTHLRAHETN